MRHLQAEHPDKDPVAVTTQGGSGGYGKVGQFDAKFNNLGDQGIRCYVRNSAVTLRVENALNSHD